jgi:hypothetical protein
MDWAAGAGTPRRRMALSLGLMPFWATRSGITLIVMMGVRVVLMDVRTVSARAPRDARDRAPISTGRTTSSVDRVLWLRRVWHVDTLVEYRNPKYGFCFSLPSGWRGYSIVVGRWNGLSNGSGSDDVVQHGPVVSIRHPLWTSAEPRQDIPIMVFTHAQWRSLQHDDFHVSAAPMEPTELGRNPSYVLALPPRFDYAFPPGYEEVEQTLSDHPLRGQCQADRPQH